MAQCPKWKIWRDGIGTNHTKIKNRHAACNQKRKSNGQTDTPYHSIHVVGWGHLDHAFALQLDGGHEGARRPGHLELRWRTTTDHIALLARRWHRWMPYLLDLCIQKKHCWQGWWSCRNLLYYKHLPSWSTHSLFSSLPLQTIQLLLQTHQASCRIQQFVFHNQPSMTTWTNASMCMCVCMCVVCMCVVCICVVCMCVLCVCVLCVCVLCVCVLLNVKLEQLALAFTNTASMVHFRSTFQKMTSHVCIKPTIPPPTPTHTHILKLHHWPPNPLPFSISPYAHTFPSHLPCSMVCMGTALPVIPGVPLNIRLPTMVEETIWADDMLLSPCIAFSLAAWSWGVGSWEWGWDGKVVWVCTI